MKSDSCQATSPPSSSQTERHWADRSLGASEELLATTFNLSSDGMALWRVADRTIMRANEAAARLWGSTPAALMGKPVPDYADWMSEAERARFRQALQAQGEVINYETMLIPVDGQLVAFIISARLLTIDEAPCLLSVLRDMTERQQAAAVEQQLRHFSQATLDALSSHLAVLDEQGQVIAVNQAWQRFTPEKGGVLQRCGIGDNYLAVCESASGRGVTEGALVAQGIREVITGQQPTFCLEYPCQNQNQRHWFNLQVTRCDDTGPLYIVVAHEDITERKQAEQKLQRSEAQLAEAQRVAHIGSWEWSVGALEWTWSDEMYRIFGLPVGATFPDAEAVMRYQHPDDRALVEAALEKALTDGQPFEYFNRIRRTDGVERVLHSRGAIVTDAAGQPLRLYGTAQDVTELKQAEAALQRANVELESRVAQRTQQLEHVNEELRSANEQLQHTVLELDRAAAERERAEAALTRLSQQLHLILNSAGEGVCGLDEQGRATFVNVALRQVLGWSEAELIGQSFHTLAHHTRADGSPYPEPECPISATLHDGLAQQVRDEIFWTKEGRAVPVEYISTPIFEQAKVTGAVVMFHDISKRKTAEAQLAQSMSLLQATLESTADGILVIDGQGNILNFNQRFLEMWRIPADLTCLGDNRRLIEYVMGQLQDPATFVQQMDELHEAREHESYDVLEFKDGRIFERCAVPQRLDGRGVGRVLSFRDMTQRYQAEQELRDRARQQEVVAELGRYALSGSDLNALRNRAAVLVRDTLAVEFSSLLELAADNQSLVMRAQTGWGPATVGQYLAFNKADSLAGYVVRSREPVIIVDTHTENRFKVPTIMHERGVRSGIAVSICTESKPFGVISAYSTRPQAFTTHDVYFMQALANVLATAIEHKQAAEAVHLARQEAERANRAKSEFLSRMSHELRTPLNAILGFGQILEMQNLSEVENESATHILKAGRHLLSLINEVLDIARVEAGRIDLSIEAVAVDEVLWESLDLVRPLAAKRAIQLAVNAVKPEHSYIQANRQRLKQVFINLLSNAVKYNSEAGQVTVSYQEVRADWLRIEVTDTGAGLTPDEMQLLFIPFERLNAGKSEVEGTGLGLTLSKRLIEAMHGNVGVDSVTGQGSTFYVELPLATSPLEQTQGLPESVLGAAPPIVLNGDFTVLSIEDNVSNHRLIEAILDNRPGIKLLGAMQGSVGLDLARQHHPNLILLDLHLPDLHGHEVLNALRTSAETCAIPVVVVSADATALQIERLLAAGAKAYLTKPLDIREFLRVLDQVLAEVIS